MIKNLLGKNIVIKEKSSEEDVTEKILELFNTIQANTNTNKSQNNPSKNQQDVNKKLNPQADVSDRKNLNSNSNPNSTVSKKTRSTSEEDLDLKDAQSNPQADNGFGKLGRENLKPNKSSGV